MLANDFGALKGFAQQLTIRFNDQFDCFLKIQSRLFEGVPLRVCPGKFFDEPDVAFGYFLEDCRKIQSHRDTLLLGQYTTLNGGRPILNHP